MLNSQLINGVMIDWDKIDHGSYLRNIEAINSVDHIVFTHPVTFFVGENGSGKSTLLEAIAIAYGFNPEGGTRNYITFLPTIHILIFAMRSVCPGVFVAPDMDISFAQRVFITLPQRKKNTAENRAASRSIFMRNPMGRVSWHLHRIASGRTDCICWMNRKRRFPRSGSLHCLWKSTGV